jgi:hypothetical protein
MPSRNKTPCIRASVIGSLSILTAFHAAQAQQAAAPATVAAAPATASDDLEEIVVNGIKRGELVLPTTVTSTSAYGLDLGVMDTPRNNTELSRAQLDALNVQNPEGFSYLTSSSYTDASFGVPNVPRIRGQYGDMFFNGMRDSFTANGYGGPVSFNSVDSIDITRVRLACRRDRGRAWAVQSTSAPSCRRSRSSRPRSTWKPTASKSGA